MDLSESVAKTLYPPSCAFVDIRSDCQDLLDGNGRDVGRSMRDDKLLTTDFMSPSNFDSPEVLARGGSNWRIDGCTDMGTRFFATPIFLQNRLIPKRIDLFVKDQYDQTPKLRLQLGSSSAFCVHDGRVARLPIASVLCRALDQVSVEKEWLEKYLAMPFGSRLLAGNLSTDSRNVKIHLASRPAIENSMSLLTELKSRWTEIPPSAWPASIDLQQLLLINQIHESVSLVRIPTASTPQALFAFKSSTDNLSTLYRELWLLLRIGLSPGDRNAIPRVQCIVTLREPYMNQEKVCGFLLPYFSGGNLANALAKTTGMPLNLQLKWAKQITRTLQLINTTPAGFYSELKPDNLLLVGQDGWNDIMFIDFEQRSNWMDFSAPEVHYAEFLEYLVDDRNTDVPEDERAKYEALYRKHIATPRARARPRDSRPGEQTVPWSWFTAQEVEKAEVYSLGMLLYCIFECVPSNKNCMTKVYARDADFIEYPNFRRTPKPIQKLILRCTRGTDVDTSAQFDVVRVGSMVWPRGLTGRNGQSFGTAYQTLEACQRMWQQKLEDMQQFYDAKARYDSGRGSANDAKILGYPNRPGLRDVLTALNSIDMTGSQSSPGSSGARPTRSISDSMGGLTIAGPSGSSRPAARTSQTSMTETHVSGPISENEMRNMIRQYQERARRLSLTPPTDATPVQLRGLASDPRARRQYLQRILERWDQERRQQISNDDDDQDEDEESSEEDEDQDERIRRRRSA